MAASTGPVLIAASITAASEVLGPGGGLARFNWRIVPAAAGLALALALLERIAPRFAVGLAWLAVGAVLIVPMGKGPAPLELFSGLVSTGKKVTAG